MCLGADVMMNGSKAVPGPRLSEIPGAPGGGRAGGAGGGDDCAGGGGDAAAGFEARFLVALSEALVPAEADAALVRDTAAFLQRQRRAMPHVFPAAFRLASRLVDLSTLPRRGRRFHALPPATRREVVLAWRTARIGVYRSFLKYHTVFAAYLGNERIETGEPR